MKRLLVLDEKDYDPTLPEIYRVTVRGIIFREGKLLMIRSQFGRVNFPGGGREQEESDWDALLREIQEETGYRVKPDSIREFGEVEEKRLYSIREFGKIGEKRLLEEGRIWHQINRYYFCDVEEEQGECRYSENEQKQGYQPVWLTLEEAIRENLEMVRKEGKQVWNQRELRVLQILEAAK